MLAAEKVRVFFFGLACGLIRFFTAAPRGFILFTACEAAPPQPLFIFITNLFLFFVFKSPRWPFICLISFVINCCSARLYATNTASDGDSAKTVILFAGKVTTR